MTSPRNDFRIYRVSLKKLGFAFQVSGFVLRYLEEKGILKIFVTFILFRSS